MKAVLALSLLLAAANAFAANPGRAFSQGLSDLVDRLPKDPTGADLKCSSASGKTGVFATLPGELKGTAVVIKLNGVVSADIDAPYVNEAQVRGFDVNRELSNLRIGKIGFENTNRFALSGKSAKETRFTLKEIPGTSKSNITDEGATGTIRFDALLSTRGLNNIRVSCVQDWAI